MTSVRCVRVRSHARASGDRPVRRVAARAENGNEFNWQVVTLVRTLAATDRGLYVGGGCARRRPAGAFGCRRSETRVVCESRCSSHNSHFGARSLNKKDFSIFPFKFTSMATIAEKHGVEFAKDA